MNIEKLARHLKEFTLDEIEMIAECDCKTALEQLLNEDKLVFEQGLYKYKEPEQKQTFEFIAKPKIYKNKKILSEIWRNEKSACPDRQALERINRAY